MAKKTKAAANNPNSRPANGRPVPKEVQVKLTPMQKQQRTEAAARTNQEKTELQKQFEAEEKAWKQRRAEFKNQIKNLQEQVDQALAEVKAGTATSTETVLLVLNHDAGQAEYWYEFPGEGWRSFEQRPLEDNERQTSLITEKAETMPEDGQDIEE